MREESDGADVAEECVMNQNHQHQKSLSAKKSTTNKKQTIVKAEESDDADVAEENV